MSLTFLDVASIKALHMELILRFGGSHGVRDEGLLESAVLRAEYRALYDPSATAATVGASLTWGLVKNHAFIDGNKRIGLASLVVFVELNGYRLRSTEADELRMVLSVASSETTEEQWTAWVADMVIPRAT